MSAVRPTAATAALLVGMAALLAGCGNVSASSGGSGATGSDGPGPLPTAACPSADALSPAPGTEGEPLPADVVASAVVLCGLESRSYAGEGTWTVLVERRASTGLEPLLRAMRERSEPRTDGGCTLELRTTPWFAVVATDGRWWHSAVPHDDCQKPQAAVGAALDALDLVTVAETRIRQDVTPAQQALADQAEAVGCSPVFKDVLADAAPADGAVPAAGPGPAVARPDGPTVLCRYRVGTAPYDPGALGFESGERLSSSAAGALWDAVGASGPVRACRDQHTTVTVLQAGDRIAEIETDGCHRVLLDWTALRQASPDLLAALR